MREKLKALLAKLIPEDVDQSEYQQKFIEIVAKTPFE